MTTQGILVTNVILFFMVFLVVYLVTQHKLYIGYAVIWLVLIATAMVVISVKPVLRVFTLLMGAVFPVSALTLGALALIFLALIYFSSQLSILSERLATMAQFIANEKLEREEPNLTAERTSIVDRKEAES